MRVQEPKKRNREGFIHIRHHIAKFESVQQAKHVYTHDNIERKETPNEYRHGIKHIDTYEYNQIYKEFKCSHTYMNETQRRSIGNHMGA